MAARWFIIHVYSGFEKKVMHSIREQAIQQGLVQGKPGRVLAAWS